MKAICIRNQGIIKSICDALNISFNESIVYTAYINPSANDASIYSGFKYFYKGHIKPEIIKVLNEILNK